MNGDATGAMAPGSDQKCAPRIGYAAIAFTLVSIVYLSALWITRYGCGDANYDDKAVHYYCAARLYATPEARAAIECNRSGWLNKLPESMRFRTDIRLSSFGIYLLPSSILRAACEPYRSPGGAPRSFALPFRNASFLAHIVALCIILGLAIRFPIPGSIVMLCLVAASFKSLNPSWLAGVADYNSHYLTYAPRCSAILVLVAAAFAYIQRQWLMAVISLLLLFVWHAGCGLFWVPLGVAACVLSSLSIVGQRKMKMVVVGSLVTLAVLIAPFMELQEQPRLWCALVIACFFANARIPRLSQSLRVALMTTAWYLYLTQLLVVVVGIPGVRDALLTYTHNDLVTEVSARFEGTRHIAAVALVVLVIVGVANLLTARWTCQPWRTRALLAAELMLLTFAVYAHRGSFLTLASGNLPFFTESDVHINRISVTYSNLATLDPNHEAEFFSSLGDFLICGGNKANGARPAMSK